MRRIPGHALRCSGGSGAKPARKDSSGQQGFTLLEVMVVLAIVALAAVTVYPRLGVGGDQAALRTTVLELEARLRSARAAAVRTNAPQTFSIDTSARTYWSSVEPRPRALGRNVRLRLDGDGFEATGDTTHVLSFRGDGSAADVSIKLASGSRAATIDVDWLTGASRIVWGP